MSDIWSWLRAAWTRLQFGEVPFYDMNTLALTDADIFGLGGLRSLRGYKQARFDAMVASGVNLELRWTFQRLEIGCERFGLMVMPTVDLGCVFDLVAGTTLQGWKHTQGAASRSSWNRATIATFDVSFSGEAAALYVDFGHQLQYTRPSGDYAIGTARGQEAGRRRGDEVR